MTVIDVDNYFKDSALRVRADGYMALAGVDPADVWRLVFTDDTVTFYGPDIQRTRAEALDHVPDRIVGTYTLSAEGTPQA